MICNVEHIDDTYSVKEGRESACKTCTHCGINSSENTRENPRRDNWCSYHEGLVHVEEGKCASHLHTPEIANEIRFVALEMKVETLEKRITSILNRLNGSERSSYNSVDLH